MVGMLWPPDAPETSLTAPRVSSERQATERAWSDPGVPMVVIDLASVETYTGLEAISVLLEDCGMQVPRG